MFNLNNLRPIIRDHHKLILILSLAYSAVLIFPAFGPVLSRVSDEKTAVAMSSWSILFLIISFIIKPFKIEYRRNYITWLALAAAVLTLSYYFLPFTLKCVVLSVLNFTIGRIAVNWSRLFLNMVPKNSRGQVIGLILFLSYGILYIGNVVVPSIPSLIALMLPAAFVFSSAVLLKIFYPAPAVENMVSEKANEKSKCFPWVFFILITVVYITAGITYASVYPSLLIYDLFERYYNVLPFVISVPLAGIAADLKGRKSLLYIGLCFLGASFIFFSFNKSPLTYFLTQTTLQPGWAFLDAYVWIAAADMASGRRRPELQAYGVASFLLGTNIGSVISIALSSTYIVNSPYYGLLTYLPLFVVFAFLHFIPETFPINERNFNSIISSDIFPEQLTNREKEILELMFKDLDNAEICSVLYISYNTLKSHVKNIYRKLGVSSRKQLKALLNEQRPDIK